MIKTSTINYIDYLPGTGKTYWMASKLVKYLYTHIDSARHNLEIDYIKVPQLVLVVAPTISLLLEIQKTILSEFAKYVKALDRDTANDYIAKAYNSMYRLYSVASNKPKLTAVESVEDSIIINDYRYSLESNVAGNSYYEENIRQLLRDSSMSYNRATQHYAEDYNRCLKENPLECQYISTRKGLQFEDSAKYENLSFNKLTSSLTYSVGSIVFITQAAFWNANHDFKSKNKTFWNKASTWLIMDEARSCNCSSISLTLSEKTSKLISERFGESVFKEYVAIDNNFYKIPEIHNSIIEDSGYTLIAKLEKYIMQHKGSSIFIRLSTKETDQKAKRAILAIVQVPYAAFTGWKKVTLMSAFFKDSQLYAVLSSANKAGCLKSDVNFELKPETSVSTLEKNEKKIKKCCSLATVTYVYDNDSYISKRMYSKGVVYSVSSSLVSIVNKDTLTSFKICKNSKNIKQHEAFNKYASLLDFVRVNRTHSLSSEPTTPEGKHFKKLQSQLLYITPLEFAVRASIKYSMAWLKSKLLVDPSDVLDKSYCTNNILINYNKYLEGTKKLADNDLPVNIKEYYTSLTTDSRGINKYIKYRTISVLAAYNAQPAVDAWFSQFTTGYDSTKDYAIGQCIQTMLRCKVRDKYDIQPTLIILSTRGLAEDIAKRLNINVVPPNKITKLSKKYSLAFANVVSNDKKILTKEQKEQMKEYSDKSSTALKAKERFEKDLDDEELYKKAYLKKYFEGSTTYRKSRQISLKLCRLNTRLSRETDDNKKIKILSEKSSLLENQAIASKECKELKGTIEKQFVDKYLKDKQSVISDIQEYIPKVRKARATQAKYYEEKAKKLAKYEEYEARGIRREDIVEIPWEE